MKRIKHPERDQVVEVGDDVLEVYLTQGYTLADAPDPTTDDADTDVDTPDQVDAGTGVTES